MEKNKYDIFISYRKIGGAQYARILQLELEKRGYCVFLDHEEFTDGVFGDNIKEAICEAPVFMMVLSAHYLDRCKNEGDWVRKEIMLAIKQQKHFVLVNPDNSFDGIPNDIPQEIKQMVGSSQHSELNSGHLFGLSIDRMVKNRIENYVNVSVNSKEKLTPLDSKFDAYICFSHKDIIDEQEVVLKDCPIMQIVDHLTHAGFKIFFDEQDSLLGEGYSEHVLATIKAADVFVFLSTKNANESEMIRKEVAVADELGKTIIPVRLDDTPYHRSLWARIVDLNYCKYFANPSQGINDLETAIRNHQDNMRQAVFEEKEKERQRQQEEKRKRERQGQVQQLQTQIKEQQDIVNKTLAEIIELKKQVLAHQYELQSAELELQNCIREEARLSSLIQNLEHNINH